MVAMMVRRAVAADLATVADIWYEDQLRHDPTLPPMRAVPSLYEHELATEELFVAERDGQVVGFAAVTQRGPVAFLSDLFVRVAQQSTGVGGLLLRHVLPSGAPCCTVASNDPRALALYIRAGMQPQWPFYQLTSDLAGLRPVPETGIEVIVVAPGDSAIVQWDTEIGGRARPQDHRYWVQRRGGVPLWFRRDGMTIGYGYAQTYSDDIVRDVHTITLGPIGAHTSDDAVAGVLAAVDWARAHGEAARIWVPGPHPTLAPLLRLGFRIADSDTFCSGFEKPFADPRCYVPSGADLF